MQDLEIWNGLVIAVVPLIVAGIKRLAIPKRFYPVIAGVLGVTLQAITAYLANGAIDPAIGAGLGLAAVGLRETIDQLRKRR